MSAPKKGEVAFNTDAKPAESVRVPNANKVNGIADPDKPTIDIRNGNRNSSRPRPCAITTPDRNRLATITRNWINAMGPNSLDAILMKRNDPPQIAPKTIMSKNSVNRLILGGFINQNFLSDDRRC